MSWLDAIIIAIIEGITEFLPISSTGHMIITTKLLGVEPSDFVNSYIVNIQFGAILAVVVLYFKRFFQSLDFYFKLFVAFIPAAIFGLLLNEYIDMMLGSVLVVAISLVIGGVILLFVDKWFAKTSENQDITYPKALKIGLFQVIAMIPGVSRSAATIVGGMTQKLSRKNAAEFSFFLAVPTMVAASAFELYKNHASIDSSNVMMLVVGNIVAFVVAMMAIKFFINILTKFGFKAFGVYRIIIGAIIISLVAMNINLTIF